MDGDFCCGVDRKEEAMNGLTPDLYKSDCTNGKAVFTALPISALKQNGLLQSLASGGSEQKQQEVNLDVLKAEEEWEALETIHPGLPSEQAGVSDDTSGYTPLISFNEALQYFQTADLTDYKKNIQATVRRTGFSAIAHFLFGPPRLHRELQEERNLVFAIAQCVDPMTDLRGTGFLGLMHPLYFVMDSQTLPLAHEIYKLSQHETQNFPFCVLSINITRIAIQALREECLSKECNRRQQVVGVLNDFYIATFLYLYQLWKSQHKTISDSGFVLKEVEAFAKRNPRQLLKRLETYLNECHHGAVAVMAAVTQHPSPSAGGHSPKLNPASSAKEINFTGVCELPVELEGEARLI
nr:PREDICTED: ELMO domain-containing protein 3 isoform X3 [Latimeria chalumnae]|eukprot:XP_014344417.1 PREDICTED: ELMO domain-containing protein 3 isoform X3 [Latimeria chalumnae]